MKTLREIYTDLVAAHAANTPGEMVTTFSDKGSQHSYIEFYERHFEPHRALASVLELGVMTGGSLLLWQEYFDNVWLTGIDLRAGFNQELPFQNQLAARFHWGVDSTDSAQVPVLHKTHQFVIDDGAHDLKSQVQTLKNYWQFVRPGGTYFIEDIEDDISVEILQCFVKSWITTPHTVDYYRGFAHRQDDRILAVTKEIK